MKHAKQNFPHSSSHFLLCHRTIEQVSLIVFSFETRLIIVIRAFPFNVRFIDKTMFESFVPNKDHCQLCLDTVPCVQCTQCSIQYFCSECDQLYHKHIARKNHVRNRMPGFEHTQSIDSNESKLLIADPKKMPIPPPRRRKKESDQNGHTNAVVSQIKR